MKGKPEGYAHLTAKIDQLKSELAQQRIAIAEACGWRKWKFGDPWRKGLQLADQRFDGFIRRVIKDAPANSKTVLIDIDEMQTHDVSDVISDYLPASHWVRNDEIRIFPPDYLNDLNAMHDAENNLEGMNKAEFAVQLCRVAGKDWPNGIGGGSFTHIHATAAQRAEAFLRAIGKWEGE